LFALCRPDGGERDAEKQTCEEERLNGLKHLGNLS
jgi:hypothetical protein